VSGTNICLSRASPSAPSTLPPSSIRAAFQIEVPDGSGRFISDDKKVRLHKVQIPFAASTLCQTHQALSTNYLVEMYGYV